MPAPSEIDTGDMLEPYEGVRVKFTNATCIAEPNNYDEWLVNDGTGDTYIDNELLTEDFSPDLQQSYDKCTWLSE